MKKKYILLTAVVLVMFLILWFLVSLENSPKLQEDLNKYSFPVSRDIPQAKPEPVPTYDVPSITLPEEPADQDTEKPETPENSANQN